MSETSESQSPSTDDAPAPDLPPPAPAPKSAANTSQSSPQAVDNSEPEVVVPPDPVPVDTRPGDMGEGRVRLMQLLGFDVNHPFDEEVEQVVSNNTEGYAGVVNEDIWRQLEKLDPLAIQK